MATTTRSAAKQQDFEQQIASILAHIKDQKASQAEQAQSQEQQQAELLQELQRQHLEQLQRLLATTRDNGSC